MEKCVCISPGSCGMEENGQIYFNNNNINNNNNNNNGVDFFREDIPYIGRW